MKMDALLAPLLPVLTGAGKTSKLATGCSVVSRIYNLQLLSWPFHTTGYGSSSGRYSTKVGTWRESTRMDMAGIARPYDEPT